MSAIINKTQVDNSTIEYSSNKIQVKDGSISRVKTTALLGTWSSALVLGTIYQAATDLLVIATMQVDNGDQWDFFTDSNATPTTLRAQNYTGSGTTAYNGTFTIPVKKGDYFQLALTTGTGSINTYYSIPIGA